MIYTQSIGFVSDGSEVTYNDLYMPTYAPTHIKTYTHTLCIGIGFVSYAWDGGHIHKFTHTYIYAKLLGFVRDGMVVTYINTHMQTYIYTKHEVCQRLVGGRIYT